MKQEYKYLLLQDLCSRLPYGIKVKTSFDEIDEPIELKSINIKNGTFSVCDEYRTISGIPFDVYECKPYLFPLSSMTEEQKEELENLGWHFDNFEIHNVSECLGTYREFVAHLDCFVLIDWLNKYHFDYRGLIKKSLALDATGLNIY